MIYNLTQHRATKDQLDYGIIDLNDNKIKELITFNEKPDQAELQQRATEVANYCDQLGLSKVMIGGAPFFMSYLEKALKDRGIKYYYAFSKRIVVEETNENTTKKVSKFVFEGLIG